MNNGVNGYPQKPYPSGVRAGLISDMNTNTTITANAMYVARFSLDISMTIDLLCTYIVTQSGQIDIGLYSNDPSGVRPGSLIISTGSLTVPPIGFAKFPCRPTTLEPGAYWLGYSVDNAVAAIYCSTIAAFIKLSSAQTKTSSFPLPHVVTGATESNVVPMLWVEKS